MTAARYQPDDLARFEDAIVDLVRVGLKEDSASVRQLGRKLMSSRSRLSPSPELRERLGGLLLEAGRRGGALRTLEAGDLPVDPETKMPLVRVEPSPAAVRPILNDRDHDVLSTLVRERKNTDLLLEVGLEPPKTLLLSGQPGVGKTMTARYLAAELGLPLVSVELAAIMSSFLGKTGQNLRQLLAHARQADCVLLLDEFDALAKRRDDQSDVGELKRLVNVLLLELDRWPSGGLLVAATNHPQLLDPAVDRRFDVKLELGLPGFAARVGILNGAFDELGQQPNESIVAACALALEGSTGADLQSLARRATRGAILEAGSLEDALAEVALQPLRDAAADDPDKRAAFCALAHEHAGLSNREIAKLVGVTHPTVGKLRRRWSGRVHVHDGADGRTPVEVS